MNLIEKFTKNKIFLKNIFYNNGIIHCKTAQEAEKICIELNKLGCVWNNNETLIDNNEWNVNKEDTCYEIINKKMFYAEIEYFLTYKKNKTIYEYEQIIF